MGPKKEAERFRLDRQDFLIKLKRAPVICFQQRIWGLNTKNTELQRVHDGLNRDYNLIKILHWGKLCFDNDLRVQLVKWAAWECFISVAGGNMGVWPVAHFFFLTLVCYVKVINLLINWGWGGGVGRDLSKSKFKLRNIVGLKTAVQILLLVLLSLWHSKRNLSQNLIHFRWIYQPPGLLKVSECKDVRNVMAHANQWRGWSTEGTQWGFGL